MTLKMEEGVQPIRQKHRMLNPAMEKNLEKQLKDWKAQGVIEESKSPWSSPLVPVKKKDGEIRWAVDFRKVNSYLQSDSYPLPNIQQLLEKAGGNRYFSSLDAVQAYFTISMDEKSRQYTAFAAPQGLFEFSRMPFGLKSAPAVYSRFICAALNSCGTAHLNCYLDDILIFTMTLTEHLTKLREVFEAHRRAGIKLKPKKTYLFQTECQYLGHMLSEKGIAMVPEYVERINNWPSPTNVVELNCMLGFFNYYRSFIPGFAELTREMNAQKRVMKLVWTETMEKNLKILKEKFNKYPIRSTPKFDNGKPFILTTDFSSKAISAILSQEQQHQERFIAATGRKTTDAESRYPAWKGECLAIIVGLRKFHSILSYKQFVIYTDNKALTFFKSLKKYNGMMARWLEELSGYDFEIIHCPGKDNLNADALSRCNHLPEPSDEDVEEQDTYVNALAMNDHVEILSMIEDLDRRNIFKEQSEDPILKEVRAWISTGTVPSRKELRGKHRKVQQYAQMFGSLKLEQDGIIIQEVQTVFGKKQRILVPDQLVEAVFYCSHVHLSAGHFGVHATVARIRRNFWFPGILTEVSSRIKACHQCLAKITKVKLKNSVHVPSLNAYPLQTLYCDIVGPLPTTREGYQYILSMQDGWSRYIRLVPLKTKTSSEIAKNLMDKFISLFGCPMRIHSDQGPEFCSALIKDLLQELEIGKTTTPTYNPNSNLVERFHKSLHQMLRTFMDRKDVEWNVRLPAVCLAYNTKVNSTTGVTPALAFLGHELKIPCDLVIQRPNEVGSEVQQEVTTILQRYNQIFDYVQKHQNYTIRRNAASYSGARKFEEGDRVWYFVTRKVPGKPAKMTNSWVGPYRIVKQVADVLYVIEPVNKDHNSKEVTVNITKLRRYYGVGQTKIPTDIDQENNDEEAEEIQPAQTHASVDVNIPIHVPMNVPDIVDRNMVNRDEVEERAIPAAPIQPEVQPPVQDEMVNEPEAVEDEIMEEPEVVVPDVSPPRENGRRGGIPEGEPVPSTSKKRRNDAEDEVEQPENAVTPRTKRRRAVNRGFKQNYEAYQQAAAEFSSDEDAMQELNSMLTIPLLKESKIPTRATTESCGVDFKSPESKQLCKHTVTAIDLKCRMKIPAQYFMQLHSRSSLARFYWIY